MIRLFSPSNSIVGGSAFFQASNTAEGVEYDTGDTYQGSAVYFKRIDVGTLPNNTNETFNHNITGLDKVLPHSSMMVDNGSTYLICSSSYVEPGISLVNWSLNGSTIRTQTNFDATSYTGEVWLYYTRSI